jgi:hypothetical protein
MAGGTPTLAAAAGRGGIQATAVWQGHQGLLQQELVALAAAELGLLVTAAGQQAAAAELGFLGQVVTGLLAQ